jgi:oleate hydratase
MDDGRVPDPGPPARACLVGGGIAALASAAYLIRDGGFAGQDILVLEEAPQFGGSLDGGGSPETGYVSRGERIFTYGAFACAFDLLSFIPSLTDPDLSVTDEIYRFNEQCVHHPNCRLVAQGRRFEGPTLDLTNRDRLALVEIMALPEFALGTRRIDEMFRAAFFQTVFWRRLCTPFAFQPWHSAVELKRYFHRFIGEFPHIRTFAEVRRTPLNQYDSIVRPLVRWLEAQGVRFAPGARVLDLDFRDGPNGRAVETIHYVEGGIRHQIALRDDDLVFVTNGSMTAASSRGSMTSPARLDADERGGAWTLWETLAAKAAGFGRPEVFTRDVDRSKWLSFTVTLSDPTFFDLMERFTGNSPGTGGLVTLLDSSWLMSILLPHQPHFLGQPDGVQVFWGYGLSVDREGVFVNKKMSDCTGEELMTELLGHLKFDADKEAILASATCIPCMMPFITSQFMPRARGDRPPVRPDGTTNLAFIGQFCEIPEEVVFTVEYSVRSAQIAVYSLLGLDKPVSPLHREDLDPSTLLAAARTLVS